MAEATGHTLYLIFDNEEGTDDDKMKLMDEIIELANKTKLPCHIVGQKVLFYSGSMEKAYIHTETEHETIEKLKKKGFTEFIKGDGDTNDDINYFKRMAESVKGENFLPVIIALENGKMTSKVEKLLATSTTYQMPIICFKKTTHGVSVLWYSDIDNEGNIEYKTDSRKPWQITKCQPDSFLNKIAYITEIRADVDTIICNLIVSVCLEEASSTDGQHVTYYTALTTYLIEKGDWTIYKQYIKTFFNERYLENMHEEVMSNQNNSSDNLPGQRGRSKELLSRNFESNGLLFFALLFNKCSDEALQLLEEGYVGIHYILIGCVLLDNDINSWKTPIVVKEKLQRYKSAFTERAIAIIGSIYGAYKEKEEAALKDQLSDGHASKWTTICNKEEENTSGGNGLDDNINHAERLLLNHGYLRDAITTENNLFLKNETVKTILNKKWYGTENINLLTMFIFVVLAVVHPLVLPFLMINMERRPLQWLYMKYQLPFLKVVIQMLGFAVVIIAYAYMLLFDYSDDGITSTDCFIIVWMVSFVVDETKQVIVALIREQLKNYAKDWWNILDWLFVVGYTSGMLVRAGEGSGFQGTSKCLLLAAFMLLCIRTLNLCCMTEFLGPKLVIIRKMIRQTVSFMTIMTVIMVWYSVSVYALLYPNSEFSWTEIEKIVSNGYWVLFGELNLDAETLTVPDCTFNNTIYESGVLQRCPSPLGVHLTPYLKALYGLISVILLLNLLIALYSDAFNKVQQESESYWRKIQLDFLEEYCIKTAFPIHLQLLALPGTILTFLWFWCSCLCTKYGPKQADSYETPNPNLNNQPMIVRAFLYEANYDIKLESTYAAEKKSVKSAKGKIDLSAIDAITTKIQLDKIEVKTDNTKLQLEKIEETTKTTKIKMDKIAVKTDKLMDRLRDIEIMMKKVFEKHHEDPTSN